MTTIKLTVRVYILRSAFASLQSLVQSENRKTDNATAKMLEKDKGKAKAGRPGVVDETKDTEAEFILKERKFAINRLFDKLRLRPVQAADILKKHKKKGKIDSKRAILEHYDAKGGKDKNVKPKNTKSKGKGKAEEGTPDGSEMTEEQVQSVFSHSRRDVFDMPMMDPPESFALDLRRVHIQA